MPFCYETLVDSGEADFVFFGSFLQPGSRDVLVVKESRLILYTFARPLHELHRAPEGAGPLVEHVHEAPFFGCVLACSPLRELVHVPAGSGSRSSGGSFEQTTHADSGQVSHTYSGQTTHSKDDKTTIDPLKKRKLDRPGPANCIDGVALLLDDGTLLVCYFDADELEFTPAAAYSLRSEQPELEGAVGDGFPVFPGQAGEGGASQQAGPSSSPHPLGGSFAGQPGPGFHQDAELAYDTHLLVYATAWEVSNEVAGRRVYARNFLLALTRRQSELHFLALQSMCSVGVSAVHFGGASAGVAASSAGNNGVGVGASASASTDPLDQHTHAPRAGPKLLLAGHSAFDVNAKFNLANSFVKGLAFVEGYYMPVLGLLITNYAERIGTSCAHSGAPSAAAQPAAPWLLPQAAPPKPPPREALATAAPAGPVGACSLLVLNVELLSLSVSVIGRTDNLLLDTLGVRGLCLDEFVGFLCYNNEFVFWFKLFNSVLRYQLVSAFALFHPCLPYVSGSGRDRLLNAMSLGVELSGYHVELVQGFSTGNDGDLSGSSGLVCSTGDLSNCSGSVSSNGDLPNRNGSVDSTSHTETLAPPPKYLLLLPHSPGRPVFRGRFVYSSGEIVNVEWAPVGVRAPGSAPAAQQLCGTHCALLSLPSGQLLLASTGSENLLQLSLLSESTPATDNSNASGDDKVNANGSDDPSPNGAHDSNQNGLDDHSNTNDGGALELTVADIPIRLKFSYTNRIGHAWPAASLACLLSVRSTGLLRCLTNHPFRPALEQPGPDCAEPGLGADRELNLVLGIRNERELVHLVRRPPFYLQAALSEFGFGGGANPGDPSSAAGGSRWHAALFVSGGQLLFGRHQVRLQDQQLSIASLGASGKAAPEGALLRFTHADSACYVCPGHLVLGGRRVELPGGALPVSHCDHFDGHLLLLAAGGRLLHLAPDALASCAAGRAPTPSSCFERVRLFNRVPGSKALMSFVTLDDSLHLFDLAARSYVFHLVGLRELRSTLPIVNCTGGGAGSGCGYCASAGASSSPGTADISSSHDLEGEQIMMCRLTALEGRLHLLLVVSGHPLRVYSRFRGLFRLVRHAHVQPFPSLLLRFSPQGQPQRPPLPQAAFDAQPERLYRLVPRLCPQRTLSAELVSYPFVDVEASEVVRLGGPSASSGPDLFKTLRKLVSNRPNHRLNEKPDQKLENRQELAAVLAKFRTRFASFRSHLLMLRSQQRRLFLYRLELVTHPGDGPSQGSLSSANVEAYLDDGVLYVADQSSSALRIYSAAGPLEQYLGALERSTHRQLHVSHLSGLAVSYADSPAKAPDSQLFRRRQAVEEVLADGYLLRLYDTPGAVSGALGGGSGSEGGACFDSAKLVAVSGRYYRYSPSDGTVAECLQHSHSPLGGSADRTHSARSTGTSGHSARTPPNSAQAGAHRLGKLVALVVGVREHSLRRLYELLDARTRLQLVHIEKEATKLDKLSVNRQLRVFIQYYQSLGVGVGEGVNEGNGVLNGEGNPLDVGIGGSDTATSQTNNPQNKLLVAQHYLLLMHSSDLARPLAAYRLENFERALSVRFGQIYGRELVLLGTSTNLGEFVESKGEVLMLDFLLPLGGSAAAQLGAARGAPRPMRLHYKKSFLYPVTHVSTLESELSVPVAESLSSGRASRRSRKRSRRAAEKRSSQPGPEEAEPDGSSRSGSSAASADGRNWPEPRPEATSAPAPASTSATAERDRAWLRAQFDGANTCNHIVHSVGSNVYVHEIKGVQVRREPGARGSECSRRSRDVIVRGAFSDLFTSISCISVFNKFLLIGDVLKGLSFFMYIYDSSNDSKNIIRIASTNPKVNLPVLSCCPLLSRSELTLLASDTSGNLLQFVPSNNINTDKDKLIIIAGIRLNNNVSELLRCRDDRHYSILALGSCGSIYKLSMPSEAKFNVIKSLEGVYENYKRATLNAKHSSFAGLNLTQQMLNLQESMPSPSQSVVSLDLLRDFYYESAEFYKFILAKLNLSTHSLVCSHLPYISGR